MANDGSILIPNSLLLNVVIANNIRKLRMTKELTQDELARACGISRMTISSIEKCKRTISLDSLLRITKALGVSANTILDGWEKAFEDGPIEVSHFP